MHRYKITRQGRSGQEHKTKVKSQDNEKKHKDCTKIHSKTDTGRGSTNSK